MSTYMYTHVSNKNIPFGPQRWMWIVWSCFQQKSELSGQWTYNYPSRTVTGMVTVTKTGYAMSWHGPHSWFDMYFRSLFKTWNKLEQLDKENEYDGLWRWHMGRVGWDDIQHCKKGLLGIGSWHPVMEQGVFNFTPIRHRVQVHGMELAGRKGCH